jgi:AcrR family transcriptional regulator
MLVNVTKLSREEWIAGAFAALCDGGIESLRIEKLAARLGVTKGSFYHYFKSRRALHLVMLEEWERIGTSQIIARVEGAEADPLDQLYALADRTFSGDPTSDAIETALRSWARSDETVAEALARVDTRRVRFVASLLERIGLPPQLAKQRATMMYRLMIGEFSWRLAGGPKSTEREIADLVNLVVSQPGPPPKRRLAYAVTEARSNPTGPAATRVVGSRR